MKANVKTSTVQTVFQILLGAALLYAGISHMLWNRTEFLAQVPNWVPLNADLVVILSGVAEISLGFSLVALHKWKTFVGAAAALFFILIFPGNISQYMNGIDAFGLDTDRARLIRLVFQPLLVVWAVWATGAWKAYKEYKAEKTVA